MLELRSYIMLSSYLVVWIGGRPGPVWLCVGLSVTGAVSPPKPPNIRASAVLRYCIVFGWIKQVQFICLHIAMELSAACVLGLYWEFMVLLLLGRAYTPCWKRNSHS